MSGSERSAYRVAASLLCAVLLLPIGASARLTAQPSSDGERR